MFVGGKQLHLRENWGRGDTCLFDRLMLNLILSCRFLIKLNEGVIFHRGGGFLWHQRRRASKTTHKASITRLIPLYENHKCFTVIYINHPPCFKYSDNKWYSRESSIIPSFRRILYQLGTSFRTCCLSDLFRDGGEKVFTRKKFHLATTARGGWGFVTDSGSSRQTILKITTTTVEKV